MSADRGATRRLLEEYVARLGAALKALDADRVTAFVDLLEETIGTDRRVWVIGNGGSAATASHMACDLAKGLREMTGRPVPMVALTDSLPIITAIANDSDYADVFSDQLRSHLRDGDVVVAISGSGDSENVVRALRYARQRGATTVGLLGFDGGRAKELVDHCLHVAIDDMQIAEDVHLVLNHVALLALARRSSA